MYETFCKRDKDLLARVNVAPGAEILYFWQQVLYSIFHRCIDHTLSFHIAEIGPEGILASESISDVPSETGYERQLPKEKVYASCSKVTIANKDAMC